MAGGLVACSAPPAAQRPPVPTPTPFNVGLVATAADVAPTPTYCAGPRAVPASAGVPRHLTSSFADGIGAGPVYAVGPLDSATVALANDHAVAQGWPVKELWVINPRWHTGPITLSGHNLVTGTPLVFSFSDGSAPRASTHPKLKGSPEWARKAGTWVQYPSYVVFPSAGCYTLSATWTTGRWQVTQAVGYGQAVAAGAPGQEGLQAEARKSAVAAAKVMGHGLTVLTATLETLTAADAAGGVQLSTRTYPGSELVWQLWLAGPRAKASCIVAAPPVVGSHTPPTACSLLAQPAVRH